MLGEVHFPGPYGGDIILSTQVIARGARVTADVTQSRGGAGQHLPRHDAVCSMQLVCVMQGTTCVVGGRVAHQPAIVYELCLDGVLLTWKISRLPGIDAFTIGSPKDAHDIAHACATHRPQSTSDEPAQDARALVAARRAPAAGELCRRITGRVGRSTRDLGSEALECKGRRVDGDSRASKLSPGNAFARGWPPFWGPGSGPPPKRC